MFDWLKRAFAQKIDPFENLPHPCRVWLAIEIAAIATPLLPLYRQDVPARQLVYLNAVQREVRIALATKHPPLRRFRRVQAITYVFAGQSIRSGYPQVSVIPKLTAWATRGLLGGEAESQNCLSECRSLAYDLTVELKRAETWDAMMSKATAIHTLAKKNRWCDSDTLSCDLQEGV